MEKSKYLGYKYITNRTLVKLYDVNVRNIFSVTWTYKAIIVLKSASNNVKILPNYKTQLDTITI